ncbi:CHAT domain-containing protein [Bernardetia sp. OM2101]|uniref:CHAT domain-containing protein n=1 Tax=Bernardetia sp. OM2101 TaxID=3344876 RepID=UPI0035CF6A03
MNRLITCLVLLLLTFGCYQNKIDNSFNEDSRKIIHFIELSDFNVADSLLAIYEKKIEAFTEEEMVTFYLLNMRLAIKQADRKRYKIAVDYIKNKLDDIDPLLKGQFYILESEYLYDVEQMYNYSILSSYKAINIFQKENKDIFSDSILREVYYPMLYSIFQTRETDSMKSSIELTKHLIEKTKKPKTFNDSLHLSKLYRLYYIQSQWQYNDRASFFLTERINSIRKYDTQTPDTTLTRKIQQQYEHPSKIDSIANNFLEKAFTFCPSSILDKPTLHGAMLSHNKGNYHLYLYRAKHVNNFPRQECLYHLDSSDNYFYEAIEKVERLTPTNSLYPQLSYHYWVVSYNNYQRKNKSSNYSLMKSLQKSSKYYDTLEYKTLSNNPLQYVAELNSLAMLLNSSLQEKRKTHTNIPRRLRNLLIEHISKQNFEYNYLPKRFARTSILENLKYNVEKKSFSVEDIDEIIAELQYVDDWQLFLYQTKNQVIGQSLDREEWINLSNQFEKIKREQKSLFRQSGLQNWAEIVNLGAVLYDNKAKQDIIIKKYKKKIENSVKFQTNETIKSKIPDSTAIITIIPKLKNYTDTYIKYRRDTSEILTILLSQDTILLKNKTVLYSVNKKYQEYKKINTEINNIIINSQNYQSNENYKIKKQQFDSLQNLFFNIFIGSIEEDIKPYKRLCFIFASGELSYDEIDFAVLKDANDKLLLDSYAIQQYSSFKSVVNLYNESNKVIRVTPNDIIAIAPYSSFNENSRKKPAYSMYKRNSESKIPHSITESKLDLLGVKVIWEQEKLNADSFFESLQEKKIVHINTHASEGNLLLNGSQISISDIYLQNLSHVELIVLAACDINYEDKNNKVTGEASKNLANAFLAAGVKSVIYTTTSINSNSTDMILKFFYENLLQKAMHKDQALRAAQIEYCANTKSDYLKHPYYFSSIKLVGNPRAIVQK